MLRVADGLSRGASQRELAEVLLGKGDIGAAWRDDAPSLRLRVQRLVRGARNLGAGGYRCLLR